MPVFVVEEDRSAIDASSGVCVLLLGLALLGCSWALEDRQSRIFRTGVDSTPDVYGLPILAWPAQEWLSR